MKFLALIYNDEHLYQDATQEDIAAHVNRERVTRRSHWPQSSSTIPSASLSSPSQISPTVDFTLASTPRPSASSADCSSMHPTRANASIEIAFIETPPVQGPPR